MTEEVTILLLTLVVATVINIWAINKVAVQEERIRELRKMGEEIDEGIRKLKGELASYKSTGAPLQSPSGGTPNLYQANKDQDGSR